MRVNNSLKQICDWIHSYNKCIQYFAHSVKSNGILNMPSIFLD